MVEMETSTSPKVKIILSILQKSTILFYINPNIFTRLDDKTIFFTKEIRIAGKDEIFKTKITLQMTKEAIKQIEDKYRIKI